MADLMQQVRNAELTLRYSQPIKPSYKAQTQSEMAHHKAIQTLANGHDVPYAKTMRVVAHEGSRSPFLAPRETQKHPGYIRNESGGTFTS